MATITDELMRDMSRAVGTAYTKHKVAIGDSDSPGTLVYELNDLVSFVNGDLPKAGVISGLDAAIGVDTSTVEIAEGLILSDGSPTTVESSTLSAARTFIDSYDSDFQYGFVVAIYRPDVDSSVNSSRSKLSSALIANTSTSVSILEAALLDSYSPPFFISVDGEMIEIWAVDSDGNALVSPAYNSGTVASSHSNGAVAFATKKIIPKIICGIPVDTPYQSGGDPATFSYYPPVSEREYILLARGLATKPNTLAVARTPEVVAVEDLREIQDQPSSDMFSDTEIALIEKSAEQVLLLSQASAGGGAPESILSAMITLVPEGSSSFSGYWDDRPFVAQSNFLRGESHYGLTRFEFDDDFKEMYWDNYGSDLLTTMAIFRGDIFDGQQTYGTPPENIAGSFEPQPTSATGNLSSGTWSYRVTTVTASGESSPSSSVSILIPPSSGSYNKVILTWDEDASALYYHVYRISSVNDRTYENKITADSEVTNATHGSGGTITFDDDGSVVGTATNRGVRLTGKTLNTPVQLNVYVPPVEGQLGTFLAGDLNAAYLQDERTQNEMVVQISGLRADGSIGGPHEVTVPQYSERGYKIAVGTMNDIYVGVSDITVSTGSSLNLQGGKVVFSPYDFITVQNI